MWAIRNLVILVDCRSQWLGEIKYYRRVIIRIWVSGFEDEAREAFRAYTQLGEVFGSERV